MNDNAMLWTAAAVLIFVGVGCTATGAGPPVVDGGSNDVVSTQPDGRAGEASASPWHWPTAGCATCLSTQCDTPNPYPVCEADATCVASVIDFINCMDSLNWTGHAIGVCNLFTTGTREGVKIPPEASAITSLCINEQNPCQAACIAGANLDGGS